MAPVAVVVIELPADSLLQVEAEFGIGLAAFDIAAGERQKRNDHHRGTKARRNPVQDVHDDCGIARKDSK
jgi:hypothetical protein